MPYGEHYVEGLGKDDGGHLIASIFMGSGDIDNLVPMNSDLNRGRWKTMENSWARALEKDINAKIEVNIIADYGEDTQRPTVFFVSYRINDGDWVDDFYENERSQ